MSTAHPGSPRFEGTGVALVTPFNQDGSIDFASLTRIIEHVIEGGVDYLVSLGTTGESATLDRQEKQEILNHTLQTAAGRLPVVAGFGGNDTRAVIDAIDSAELGGISGILSVSPYYNKPTQEGIYRHYMAIDEASPLPIILYNVPSRTASNIAAETTLRLASEGDRIVAVKEASGDFTQIAHILRDRPENFLVISGDDALTLPEFGLGIDGVISVVANGWPSSFSRMVEHCRKAEFEDARRIHLNLLEAMDLIFREGNPGGIKCAMSIMGLCREELRLPCHPVSESLRSRITRLVDSVVMSPR